MTRRGWRGIWIVLAMLGWLSVTSCHRGEEPFDCPDGSTAWAEDADGDGAPAEAICESEPLAQDCDDTNSSVYPGAVEVCNGMDDDCDGEVDEGFVEATWYPDEDGDGYGDGSGASVSPCSVSFKSARSSVSSGGALPTVFRRNAAPPTGTNTTERQGTSTSASG